MDKLTPTRRSANMRSIRSKNTKPELTVRRLLRAEGLVGYRLHRRELPGRPDIAFIGRKKAIFVHGCFWHGHDCREGTRRPKTRDDYWRPKIAGNQMRDERHRAELAAEGWKVMTVWECEVKNADLGPRLKAFVRQGTSSPA